MPFNLPQTIATIGEDIGTISKQVSSFTGSVIRVSDFGENTVPGETDMRAALSSALYSGASAADRNTGGATVDLGGQVLAVSGPIFLTGFNGVTITNGTLVAIPGTWTYETGAVDFQGFPVRAPAMLNLTTKCSGVSIRDMWFVGSSIAPGAVLLDDSVEKCTVHYNRMRGFLNYGVHSRTKGGDLTVEHNRIAQFLYADVGRGNPAAQSMTGIDIRTTDTRILNNTVSYCDLPMLLSIPGGTAEVLNNKLYIENTTDNACAVISVGSGRIQSNYFGPGVVDLRLRSDLVGYDTGGGNVVYSGNYHIHESEVLQQSHFLTVTSYVDGDDLSRLVLTSNLFMTTQSNVSGLDIALLASVGSLSPKLSYTSHGNVTCYREQSGVLRGFRPSLGVLRENGVNAEAYLSDFDTTLFPTNTEKLGTMQAAFQYPGKLNWDSNVSVSTVSGDTMLISNPVVDKLDVTWSPASTGTNTLFDVDSGVRLTDASVNATVAGGTAIAFIPQAGNYLSGTFDGGVSEVGGVASGVSHLIQTTNQAVTDFTLENSTVSGVSRALLKSTSSIFPVERLSIQNNTFSNWFAELLAVNSPNAPSHSVRIVNNFSGDSAGDSVGAVNHHVYGAAGVTGLLIGGNIHRGASTEMLHVEDGTNSFVLSGNIGFDMNSKYGAFMGDNNESGVDRSVRNGVVSDNVLIRGSYGGIEGITAANNELPGHPAEAVILTGNVVDNWSTGVRVASKGALVPVHGNVASNADHGFRFQEPSFVHHANTAIDCNHATRIDRNGHLGEVQSVYTSVWDGSTAPSIVDNGTNVAILSKYGVHWLDTTINTGGGQDMLIAPLGAVMRGLVSVSAHWNFTNYRAVIYDVDWDGTTLTASLLGSVGTGISLVGMYEVGGNLSLRLAVGVARTGVDMSMTFDGKQIIT